MSEAKTRVIHMADEQKVQLKCGGRLVAEIEFSISEQRFEVSVYGRGAVANPITLGVDTNMLGHSETDDEA